AWRSVMEGKRAWLCLGPLLLCLLDGVLTLAGQPGEYWQGDFEQAVEWNPVGRWPLQRHPLLFVAVLACWMAGFTGAICLLPGNLTRPVAFAVQVGHTLGAASWLVRSGVYGWLACVPLLLASRLTL